MLDSIAQPNQGYIPDYNFWRKKKFSAKQERKTFSRLFFFFLLRNGSQQKVNDDVGIAEDDDDKLWHFGAHVRQRGQR
jgi:hypothetical protein